MEEYVIVYQLKAFGSFHLFVVVLFLLQLVGRLRAALALKIWKNSPNSIWTISIANDASQLNLIYRIYP